MLLGQKLRIYTDNRNLTSKNFNTYILIIQRLIFEQYGPGIEYIKFEGNIVADALSIFHLNQNKETTQKSTYKKEIVSEINDTEEIPEGNFHINLKLIDKYQWTEPSLMAK